MPRLKRIAASVAVAASLALGGVAATAPAAEAVEPIPGMPGCYWFNFYDYMYLFHDVAGYCLDNGVTYFDFEGHYW